MYLGLHGNWGVGDEELRHRPGVTSFHRMVLCIAADHSGSSACLSVKFGATLKSCRHLLETAKEMNVEIVGIRYRMASSYHEA